MGLRIRDLIEAESDLNERVKERNATSDYILQKIYAILLEDFKNKQTHTSPQHLKPKP